MPSLRTDKPKAKFRRSFILDEAEIEEAWAESGRSPSAPVSLKSLWLNGTEVKLGGKGQEDKGKMFACVGKCVLKLHYVLFSFGFEARTVLLCSKHRL